MCAPNGLCLITWRIVAATHALECRLTRKLTERIGFSAAYRWETTLGPGDLRYDNNIVEVGIRANF